jgi:hypothetical protein
VLAPDGVTPAKASVHAELVVEPRFDRSAETDANGRFLIEGLKPGRYELEANVEGGRDLTAPGVEAFAGDAEVRIVLQRVRRLRLTLLDALTDAPVEGEVTISLRYEEGVGTGYVGPVKKDLLVRCRDAIGLVIQHTAYALMEVALDDRPEELTVRLEPAAHAAIHFLFLDDRGEPLDRVTIHRSSGGAVWMGNKYRLKEGRFHWKLPAGPHLVRVTPQPPLSPEEFDLELKPSDRLQREIRFRRGGWLLVKSRPRPSVHTDGRRVHAQLERTRPHGWRALLPPGPYTIEAGGKKLSVEVLEGETTEADLTGD